MMYPVWAHLAVLTAVQLECATAGSEHTSILFSRRNGAGHGSGEEDGDAYREKLLLKVRRGGKQVCYEELGCFSKLPPLKKAPQSPQDLDTRFLVYRSGRRGGQPKRIRYDDDKRSLAEADLDLGLPTKVVVHGFKGSLKDQGAVALVENLLNTEEMNLIFVDWEKGAQGPSYIVSAANTQLVGRQLGLLLMDIIDMGMPADKMHMIGFSLGAHIAGYAGRALASVGVRIGRITGLDPASPLFREFLKASLSSLNSEDARFVDVIHTDGAARWPSGFGLLKDLGHVDFFPNGGRDQPGCAHYTASVIVSHFEGVVNSSVVCNHARGFQLFLETTLPLLANATTEDGCRFRAFPCQSREHFNSGFCFPGKCDVRAKDGSCSVMGLEAYDSMARGPMYLVTRDRPPFCGDQLQATLYVGWKTSRVRGSVLARISIPQSNETVTFVLRKQQSREVVQGGNVLSGLAAIKYKSLSPTSSPKIRALVGFRPNNDHRPHNNNRQLYMASITVRDLDSNIWSYCSDGTRLVDVDGSGWETAQVELNLGVC